ncbi:hypothetical protein ACFLSI_06000 [Bacteroidota bacterium]
MKTKSFITRARSRLVMLVTITFLLSASAFKSDTTIEIQVSPNVLNLGNQGQWVTIHTDIAYSSVASATVTLNGIAINWWKSDNQGNFVAKFVIGDIKGLFIGPNATLPIGLTEFTLSGTTKTGELFTGTSINNIVYVAPSGK